MRHGEERPATGLLRAGGSAAGAR